MNSEHDFRTTYNGQLYRVSLLDDGTPSHVLICKLYAGLEMWSTVYRNSRPPSPKMRQIIGPVQEAFKALTPQFPKLTV